MPPLAFRKRHVNDGEVLWNDKSSADTLNGLEGDQLNQATGKSRQNTCDGEYGHAYEEDSFPTESVSQRASDGQQCGQCEKVGINHPLEPRQLTGKVRLNGRESNANARS